MGGFKGTRRNESTQHRDGTRRGDSRFAALGPVSRRVIVPMSFQDLGDSWSSRRCTKFIFLIQLMLQSSREGNAFSR